jgi:hypothetical protein
MLEICRLNKYESCNQMLVFKHADTENFHFHIVENRINYNGKNTADYFKNYARTGQFCRRMEKELCLTEAPQMRINQHRAKKIKLTDGAHLWLKSTVDKLLPQVSSVEDFRKD